MSTDTKQDDGEPTAGTADSESDILLGGITKDQAKAAVLKEHQAELVAFLQKARSAAEEYTVQKRTELVGRWNDQDSRIATLIADLAAIPHWKDGLGGVCALFAAMNALEYRLDGRPAGKNEKEEEEEEEERDAGEMDPTTAEPDAHSEGLYAQRARLLTARDAQKRVCALARRDLAAWEKPAQTLDKILSDNQKLIEEGRKMIASADTALAYDLFFKLVPMHLLIKPETPLSKVKQLDELISGCKFSDCVATVRALLTPQPSLILPSRYLPEKIEEIVKKLNDAVKELAEQEGELKKVDETIVRIVKQLEDRKKTIDKDAREVLRAAAAKAAAKAAASKAGVAGGAGAGVAETNHDIADADARPQY